MMRILRESPVVPNDNHWKDLVAGHFGELSRAFASFRELWRENYNMISRERANKPETRSSLPALPRVARCIPKRAPQPEEDKLTIGDREQHKRRIARASGERRQGEGRGNCASLTRNIRSRPLAPLPRDARTAETSEARTWQSEVLRGESFARERERAQSATPSRQSRSNRAHFFGPLERTRANRTSGFSLARATRGTDASRHARR